MGVASMARVWVKRLREEYIFFFSPWPDLSIDLDWLANGRPREQEIRNDGDCRSLEPQCDQVFLVDRPREDPVERAAHRCG